MHGLAVAVRGENSSLRPGYGVPCRFGNLPPRPRPLRVLGQHTEAAGALPRPRTCRARLGGAASVLLRVGTCSRVSHSFGSFIGSGSAWGRVSFGSTASRDKNPLLAVATGPQRLALRAATRDVHSPWGERHPRGTLNVSIRGGPGQLREDPGAFRGSTFGQLSQCCLEVWAASRSRTSTCFGGPRGGPYPEGLDEAVATFGHLVTQAPAWETDTRQPGCAAGERAWQVFSARNRSESGLTGIQRAAIFERRYADQRGNGTTSSVC